MCNNLYFLSVFECWNFRSTMTANGLWLGEGGELEVQMFMLAQKLIRIPNVQI